MTTTWTDRARDAVDTLDTNGSLSAYWADDDCWSPDKPAGADRWAILSEYLDWRLARAR